MTVILYSTCDNYSGFAVHVKELYGSADIPYSIRCGGTLNMGTNYLLGEISFITKSVAVVLQLALAIDYAIILSHRFAEESRQRMRMTIVTRTFKLLS